MLLCFAFAPGVLAADSDSYLENNGKMDIKTDRLQKTEEEKTKELEQMEETELDKNGIPLFTDEMDEKIAKEKAAEKAEYDRIKDSLFEEESTSGETVKKNEREVVYRRVRDNSCKHGNTYYYGNNSRRRNEKNKTKNSWWSNCRDTCSFSRRDLCGCAQCF